MTSSSVARSDGVRTLDAAEARSWVNALTDIADTSGAIRAVASPRSVSDVALDEQQLLQPIDQPHERDRLNLEGLGHFGLRHAFLALQPDEGPPLCPCHAVLARALVDVGSHRASHVGELKKDLSPGIGWPRHLLIISMLI